MEQLAVDNQQLSTPSTSKLRKVSKKEQEAQCLHSQKMEVIAALMRGSSVVDATQQAGVDRTTYYL
jgi:nucleoside phosphorylase